MQTIVDIGTFIASSLEIRGGRPRIVDTGVTVQRVVGWYKLGLTPEEIIDEIGHLSLAQVYAALAYYRTNRDEIEAAIVSDAQEAAVLADRHPVRTHPWGVSRFCEKGIFQP